MPRRWLADLPNRRRGASPGRTAPGCSTFTLTPPAALNGPGRCAGATIPLAWTYRARPAYEHPRRRRAGAAARARELGLLDTPRAGRLDAARRRRPAPATGCSIASFSLIDAHAPVESRRRYGIDLDEVPPHYQLLLTHPRRGPMVMPTRRPIRACDNPFACADDGIRFYAGVPRCCWTDRKLGTLGGDGRDAAHAGRSPARARGWAWQRIGAELLLQPAPPARPARGARGCATGAAPAATGCGSSTRRMLPLDLRASSGR